MRLRAGYPALGWLGSFGRHHRRVVTGQVGGEEYREISVLGPVRFGALRWSPLPFRTFLGINSSQVSAPQDLGQPAAAFQQTFGFGAISPFFR